MKQKKKIYYRSFNGDVWDIYDIEKAFYIRLENALSCVNRSSCDFFPIALGARLKVTFLRLFWDLSKRAKKSRPFCFIGTRMVVLFLKQKKPLKLCVRNVTNIAS